MYLIANLSATIIMMLAHVEIVYLISYVRKIYSAVLLQLHSNIFLNAIMLSVQKFITTKTN